MHTHKHGRVNTPTIIPFKAVAGTSHPHRKNLVISFHSWTSRGPGGEAGSKVAGRG